MADVGKEKGIFDERQLAMLQTMFDMFDHEPKNGVAQVDAVCKAFDSLSGHLPPTILENCVQSIQRCASPNGSVSKSNFMTAMANFTGGDGSTISDSSELIKDMEAITLSTSSTASQLDLEKELFELRKKNEYLSEEVGTLSSQLKEAAQINQQFTEDIVAKTDEVEALRRERNQMKQQKKRYMQLSDELEQLKADLVNTQKNLETAQRSRSKLASDLRMGKKRSHVLSLEVSQSSEKLNELLHRQQSLREQKMEDKNDNEFEKNEKEHVIMPPNTPPHTRRELEANQIRIQELCKEVVRLTALVREEQDAKNALEEEVMSQRDYIDDLRRKLNRKSHHAALDEDHHHQDQLDPSEDELGELQPGNSDPYLPRFDGVDESRIPTAHPTHFKSKRSHRGSDRRTAKAKKKSSCWSCFG